MQKVVALSVLLSPWLVGCWSCGGYRVEPHSPGPDSGRPLPARDAAAGRDVMTADDDADAAHLKHEHIGRRLGRGRGPYRTKPSSS